MREVMNRLMTFAAVLTAVLSSALTAQAHLNPAEVAERCVHRIDRIADRAENAIAEDTQECVEEIRLLIRTGRVEAAHEVARQCHNDAREVVRRASAEIRETCSECVRYLVNVGANQLARRVYDHCDDVLDDLESLLDRQQQILADALN
jgi:hypothetical protein